MLNSSIISLIVVRYDMGRKYKGPALYWRILVDGKYTWKKAVIETEMDLDDMFEYYWIRKEGP